MANARTAITVIRAMAFTFGALLAIFAIIGFAPLTAAWLAYNFHVLWVGIASLIGGFVIVLITRTLMQEVKPCEERKRMEIPA